MLNKEDEGFLVEFADVAKVSIGFTGQTQEIQNALKNVHRAVLTAMLDAIIIGYSRKNTKIPGRQS
jgi:hypothetical protein